MKTNVKFQLRIMNDQISEAVNILNKGGVIIYPTDTAFGIGCRIDNKDAIKRVFEIRKRPVTQATPVLVDGIEMAKDYLIDIPGKVKTQLMDEYWPGALTIVLECKTDRVFDLVRGGSKNLGVRMPNHKTVLEIIKLLSVPLLGPSANFHSGNTPHKFEDLDPKLISMVDYVVEGKCDLASSSTVIDCTVNPWKILRQGAVKINI